MADDFPSNSHRAKNPETAKPATPAEPTRERRVAQVVDGDQVTRRKRPLRKRMGDAFTSADGESVASFIWRDIIAPMSRDMLYDVINGGAQRAIFGEARRGPSRGYGASPYGGGGNTPYNARYANPASTPAPAISGTGRQYHNFEEIIIPERHQAEEVRTILYDLIDRFGVAKVADFYDAVGITPKFTDDRFGWDDLRGGKVRRVPGGYVLELPRPIAIER